MTAGAGVRLQVLNRWAAAEAHPDAMISLVDPGEAPAGQAPRHLVLAMHDLDAPEPTRPDLVAPTRAHADRLVAFADELGAAAHSRPVSLVIHCSAGISRSPAAAIGVLVALHPERGAAWARSRVDRLTDGFALPNAGLLGHLRDALGARWREAPAAEPPASRAPSEPAPDRPGRRDQAR